MNLAEANVVLRPRSQVDLLDLAFPFVFRISPRLFLKLGAVVLVPSFLVLVVLRRTQWTWPAVWAVAAVLGTVTQGVFTIAAGRLLFARAVSARTVLAAFARRLPSYSFALLSSRIVIALGALVVILAPIAWARAAFVHEVSLLEEASPIQAWKRSARFASARSSDALAMVIGLVTLTAMCIIAAEALGKGLFEYLMMLDAPADHLFDEGGSVYALAGYLVSIPLCACCRFLSYIDGRTRQDAWDVQVRFMAIQASQSAQVG